MYIGVFSGCDFARALDKETLNLPNDEPLPRMIQPVPCHSS